MIQPLKTKIADLLPQINRYDLKIKEVKDIACFKVNSTIYLNRHEFSNMENMKIELVRLIVN